MNQVSCCCQRSTTSSTQTRRWHWWSSFHIHVLGKSARRCSCASCAYMTTRWSELTPGLHFTFRHYNHPQQTPQQRLEGYSSSMIRFCFTHNSTVMLFLRTPFESCWWNEKLKLLCFWFFAPWHHMQHSALPSRGHLSESATSPTQNTISIQATPCLSITHTHTHTESDTSFSQITASHPQHLISSIFHSLHASMKK